MKRKKIVVAPEAYLIHQGRVTGRFFFINCALFNIPELMCELLCRRAHKRIATNLFLRLEGRRTKRFWENDVEMSLSTENFIKLATTVCSSSN